MQNRKFSVADGAVRYYIMRDYFAIGNRLVWTYQRHLIRKRSGGKPVYGLVRTVYSEKKAMLICAMAVVPIIFASRVANIWSAVLLIGLAAAAHQGFSANLFTLASDTVPRKAVGSVVGIGGMAGAVGGMFIAEIVGHVLQATGKNYLIPFLMAGFAYLIALLVIHLILPKLEPMQIAEAVSIN